MVVVYAIIRRNDEDDSLTFYHCESDELRLILCYHKCIVIRYPILVIKIYQYIRILIG